jgi:hypothetical protein
MFDLHDRGNVTPLSDYLRPDCLCDCQGNYRFASSWIIAITKKAMPAYSRLAVRNQTIAAAMIGMMKCITVASSIIMMTPMITRTRKTISSPPLMLGIGNTNIIHPFSRNPVAEYCHD